MRLLVAVDFSDASETVLAKAKEIASMTSADVWMLHVAAPEPDFIGYAPGPQSVREAQAKEYHYEHRKIQELANCFTTSGLTTIALLVQGPTAETIVAEADKLGVDLIVIGSHGHSELRHLLLGSVSEGVLHHTTRPVLIVPARPS